jgi:ribonuclease BN (tRNA processing enzyme)
MSREFQLQMLGTGTALGKKYYNNNALLYSRQGYTLMVDCGTTAMRSLHELGMNAGDIDGLLVTHLHGDHIGGIEELCWELRYAHGKKIDLLVPEMIVKPLWDNCLKGVLEITDEGLTTLRDFFNIIPMEAHERIEHGGFTLEIAPTPHINGKESYSLFINEEVFFTADIRFVPSLLEHVDSKLGCKLILHDCQLHDLAPVHASISQLMTLSPEVQEKIYLMHYNDSMEDFVGKTGHMEFLEQHRLYSYSNGELR